MDEATENLCTVALDRLSHLLLHSNAIVLKAVSNASLHLMSTKIGANLCGN